MKRKNFLTALILIVSLGVLGSGFMAQRLDLANNVNGYVTVVPSYIANTAVTGRAVNLANYNAAAMVALVDSMDASFGEAGIYIALEDSLRNDSSTSAWAVFDSVLVDSATISATGSGYFEIGYTGTGQYLRAIHRATGGAGDSIASAVMILRGGCRTSC